MPFAPDTSTRSYSETRKRGSGSYVKFTPAYRTTLRILNPSAKLSWKHWVSEANSGRGMMANCPNTTAQAKVCPICASLAGRPKDDPEVSQRKARPRYMVNVLDRTPYTVCNFCSTDTPGKQCINCGADLKGHDFAPLNKVKILEGGPRLFKETLNAVEQMQLEELGKDILQYDIVFQASGEGRDRKVTAIPQGVSDLDDNWLLDPETNEPQKLFDLELLAEPTSVEEIEAMLKGATMEELNALRNLF